MDAFKLSLKRFTRDDFVQRAVTIEVDSELEIAAIELYDASLGILRWRQGLGLGRLKKMATQQ